MQSLASTVASRPPEKHSGRVPHAERRVQLLDTAREIILCEGVGALNMSALAEAVGVAKPIVYKHFSNAEDVIIALLNEYSQGSIRATAAELRDAETIFAFFDKLVDCLFDYIGKNGAIVRSITNGFSSSAKIDAYFLAIQQRSLRIYRHLLVQQGVAERKAVVAAYAMMEMINTTIPEFASRGDQEDKETFKELVRGVISSLVIGQGTKPEVPLELLDRDIPVRNAGPAEQRPSDGRSLPG